MIENFVDIVTADNNALWSVSGVLSRLYKEYVSNMEFWNADRFHRYGDEVGKPILDEQNWFYAMLRGDVL